MFTGIIETVGKVLKVESEGANRHFLVSSDISDALKVDQSVSHDGVCLTVTRVESKAHWVTAIDETLKRSALGNLKAGGLVNLERCMLNNGRFDGHIVQGHVDQTGVVRSITDQAGSWLFDIEYDPALGNITVEKGSVCVNGVSLTCFNSRDNGFTVAIIPYTFDHTNFSGLRQGDVVNLEFDIVGKYVKKLLASSLGR
ncbi:MAG TPA: riboflavin synthase [Chryseosolibacter sp.]|nr:riboflavin synthase [Chryseosolibacter sp.]